MIRFYLQELMATKLFNEGKRVTLTELSEGTGISRVTLSKMVNQRGYNATTDNLDRICAFLDEDRGACGVCAILSFVRRRRRKRFVVDLGEVRF